MPPDLPLTLIWAISDQNSYTQHRPSNYGGFRLSLYRGSAEEVESDKRYWINVHGALMAVAWVLLMPLGTMLPTQRWDT